MNVTFRVHASTRHGESVFVMGDCPQLGTWKPEGAHLLTLEAHGESESTWGGVVQLPAGQTIQYRYFVAVIVSDAPGKGRQLKIESWETNPRPRMVAMKDNNNTVEEATYGMFGGVEQIDKGWLTGQTEVHLRLHSNPIQMWKSAHRQQVYRIKCAWMDLTQTEPHMVHESDDSLDYFTTTAPQHRIEVAVLNGQNDKPHSQPQFGTVLREDEYMSFRAQTFQPHVTGYHFDFYVHDNGSSEDTPKHVGTACILPVNMRDLTGVKIIPIYGLKHKPIGQLTVDYLTINPMDYQCDMSTSFCKYWNRKRRPLDVGHRGMGNSHTSRRCATVRENTIASLSEAGGHGADFVEFDVQLSKDMIPVIYHDFFVCLTLKKRNQDDEELFEIPVADLTLAQLQMLKLAHISEKSKDGGSPGGSTELDPADQQPFPTLERCFQHLDPHIGFNVEIKYPAELKDGSGLEEGVTQFMERNKYLDIILPVVLQNAGNRRVVFSCFDPDICTMIRLKQNRFPVLFLANGEIDRYVPYKDPRTWTIPRVASFAVSESLLGVNPHSENLLKDESHIQHVLDRGLVLFCWGDENNQVDNINKLKDKGVDGVIYDRIYELKSSKGNIFKLEYESKTALLREVGALNGKDESTTLRNRGSNTSADPGCS